MLFHHLVDRIPRNEFVEPLLGPTKGAELILRWDEIHQWKSEDTWDRRNRHDTFQIISIFVTKNIEEEARERIVTGSKPVAA